MTFRKEKKIKLSYYELNKIKAYLLDNGMSSLYPKRKINSQYFDTKNLKMFQDSEEGVLPRKKIRVRWYFEKKYFLEKKISSIEGRFKQSKEINQNFYNDMKTVGYLDKDYGLIFPILTVSYERSYFDYKKMRITFDENIEYSADDYFNYINKKDFESVLEIKTSFNTPDDYILKEFSHIDSRFSKYCRGVLALR